MKVAVLCERTAAVRSAFEKLGHYAVSYDIQDSLLPGNHIKSDLYKISDKHFEQYDLIVAFPPCTYLSNAGNAFLNQPGRSAKRFAAFQFVKRIYNLPVKHIAIENPVGYLNKNFRPADQIVHPYYFGDPDLKRTCLWLKNLPVLRYHDTIIDRPKPYYFTAKGYPVYFIHLTRNPDFRSATFPGIAKAMAEQWSAAVENNYILEQLNFCF